MRPSRGTFVICGLLLVCACDDGGVAPSGNELTLTVLGTGSGTVHSTPGGIECVDVCTAEYAEGAGVVLTALADAGSVFDGWSGGGCGGGGPCVVTMTEDAAVQATFTATPPLDVVHAGGGSGAVTSVPAGIDCGSDCSEAFRYGTEVTLTAVPGTHSSFAGWSGGGCSGTGTCQTTVNAAGSVTATFDIAEYAVAIATGGNGSGTVASTPSGIDCGGTCDGSFLYGTQLALDAVPATGSAFAGWSGGGCTGLGACVVDVEGDVSVTATFTLLRYSLDILLVGAASEDVVTSSPAGISCTEPPKAGSGDPVPDCVEEFDYGTTVILSTSTAPGITALSGWSGGGCGRTTRCFVTVTGATTVTASYVPSSSVYDAGVVEN